METSTEDAELADERLYGSIGRLTISWALIESILDGIIAMIHHGGGGKTIESEMPWMLKRKVKYIRKCFSRLDVLQPISADVPKLMSDIIDASEMRQDIIHGVTLDMPGGSSRLKMFRYIRGGEFLDKKHFEVTALDILRSATEAAKLATLCLDLGNNVVRVLGLDKLNKPIG